MITETCPFGQSSAARMLKSAERTAYHLIQEGRLRAIRVAGQVLCIPETAFNKDFECHGADPDEGLRSPRQTQ